MLAPHQRIRTSSDIRHLMSSGSVFHFTYGILFVLPNEYGYSRCAFVASKKIGNSVVRHRSVRLLREAMRPLLAEMVPIGTDVLIVAKGSIKQGSLQEISTSLSQVVQKAFSNRLPLQGKVE